MPTISGKYKFNSTLPQLAEGEYPVTFTSNGGTFAKFAVEGSNFYYLTASNDGVNAYLFGVNFWNSGEAYRDIDFGSTPQTISDTLYNYLVANAAKEETQTTFDLSTLNLSEGSHTITAKAKADGYKESEASNAVTYTVASGKKITALSAKNDGYAQVYLCYIKFDGIASTTDYDVKMELIKEGNWTITYNNNSVTGKYSASMNVNFYANKISIYSASQFDYPWCTLYENNTSICAGKMWQYRSQTFDLTVGGNILFDIFED